MFDPLGALVITFIAMSLISISGVALLFFVKNKKWEKRFLLLTGIWGLIVAYCNYLIVIPEIGGGYLLAGGIGILAAAAILLGFLAKNDKALLAAKLMAAVSVLGGMAATFLV